MPLLKLQLPRRHLLLRKKHKSGDYILAKLTMVPYTKIDLVHFILSIFLLSLSTLHDQLSVQFFLLADTCTGNPWFDRANSVMFVISPKSVSNTLSADLHWRVSMQSPFLDYFQLATTTVAKVYEIGDQFSSK